MAAAMSSPSRYSTVLQDAANDKSGFFHPGHSCAPKIPTSQRFKGGTHFGSSLAATPGPGQYDGRPDTRLRGVATIGKASRWTRSASAPRRESEEATPGPAAYESARTSFTGTRAVATIGREQRRPLHQSARGTDDLVGPGSYETERGQLVARSPARLTGPATIGRAPRKHERPADGPPGPGYYEAQDPDRFRARTNPAARGGTFGRSSRSAVFTPRKAEDSPGVGQYSVQLAGSTFGGKKSGGTIGRSSRSIDFRAPTTPNPGPGSYSPQYSAHSRFSRGGYSSVQ
eukprot:TRINITY_DN13584_c1_g1_i1.p1 TRINITY_DN13584_c1_g1~~TRINITY_DN13584_c1_g1_i1.p1  ORF type:complete len:287 (+),score=30.71 TRINITY_DN13584_c1_g1_i1:78-938(+)